MKKIFSGLFETVASWLFSFLSFQGLVFFAVPMRSTDFRAVVEPILNEVADGVYDQRKDEYKAIFEERTGIARAYHEEPLLYGMKSAPNMPDGTKVAYDQGGQLFNKRYQYYVYGIGFALTQILVEDGDHVRIGSIMAKHGAQSIIETLETVLANHLNFAFTNSAAYFGGDGAPLCYNAHAAAQTYAAGSASTSNVLSAAAALSQTSLEQMIVQIRQAADPRGKKIQLTPRKLIVSPANMLQAEVLVKSVLRTGNANNDLNPVNSMKLLSDVVTLSRLTSNTAWFIKTEEPNGLSVLWRRKPTKSMEGDFDTDTMRYKQTMRFGSGWTEWRDIYGTAGI